MGGVHAFLQLAVEALDVETERRGVVSELAIAHRVGLATVGALEIAVLDERDTTRGWCRGSTTARPPSSSGRG